MTTSAVLPGRRLPSKGQRYGSAVTWRPRLMVSSRMFASPRQCLRRLGLIIALRRCETAGRAVGDFDFGFPWQAVASFDQVLHVRVRTVLRAAFDSDVAAMPELVDVVF